MPAISFIILAGSVIGSMAGEVDRTPRPVVTAAAPRVTLLTDADRTNAVQTLLDSGLRIGNPFPGKSSSQPLPSAASATRARYTAQLARIAMEGGLDRSPDVVRAVAGVETVVLAEKLMQSLSDSISIDESEVRTRFDAAPELYDEFEMSHILFAPDVRQKAPERAEAAAMSRAREVQAKLLAGEEFAKLATEYSDDAQSSQEVGALPTILGANIQPVFRNAVARLKDGEFSEIVKGEHGYHIVRLNRRTHAYAGPARTMIEGEIRQRELRRLLEQLEISGDGGK